MIKHGKTFVYTRHILYTYYHTVIIITKLPVHSTLSLSTTLPVPHLAKPRRKAPPGAAVSVNDLVLTPHPCYVSEAWTFLDPHARSRILCQRVTSKPAKRIILFYWYFMKSFGPH